MRMYGANILYPLQVRTIYADLLEQLEDLALDRPLALLGSCQLVVKAYSGRKYLYVQGRLSTGAVRQVYLGPFDSRAERLLGRFGVEKSFAAGIGTLAKLLRAAGIPALGREWRMIDALAQGGFFRCGGVLVGDLAYLCFSGWLGVRLPTFESSEASIWKEAPVPIEVVSGEEPCGSALELLEQGHSPLLQADPGRDQIRFCSRAESELLRYLVEDPLPAIALGRRAVLVRVPHPAQYAVYALLTFDERSPHGPRALLCAAEIEAALRLVDPEALEDALEEARQHGPEWAERIDAGYAAMHRLLENPT